MDGRILWANLHLLFWPSLFPFSAAWMGENSFAPWPVALYGAVLMMAGAAYFVLTVVIGFYFTRRGGSSMSEYFTAGGNVPWWLAGVSMVGRAPPEAEPCERW